jgi:hypothetical protein
MAYETKQLAHHLRVSHVHQLNLLDYKFTKFFCMEDSLF